MLLQFTVNKLTLEFLVSVFQRQIVKASNCSLNKTIFFIKTWQRIILNLQCFAQEPFQVQNSSMQNSHLRQNKLSNLYIKLSSFDCNVAPKMLSLFQLSFPPCTQRHQCILKKMLNIEYWQI